MEQLNRYLDAIKKGEPFAVLMLMLVLVGLWLVVRHFTKKETMKDAGTYSTSNDVVYDEIESDLGSHR